MISLKQVNQHDFSGMKQVNLLLYVCDIEHSLAFREPNKTKDSIVQSGELSLIIICLDYKSLNIYIFIT